MRAPLPSGCIAVLGLLWAWAMPCPAGTSDTNGGTPVVMCDLSAGRPWIPPLVPELTPEITAMLQAFTRAHAVSVCHPRGRGQPAAQAAAARDAFATLGLSRGADGKVVAARPFHWAMGADEKQAKTTGGKPGFAESVYPVLNQMRRAYESCQPGSAEAAFLEEPIRMILDYLADQDIGAAQPGYCALGMNDYRFRALKPVHDFVALSHLVADPGRRARIAENLWWLCEGAQLLVELPWLKTDTYLNNLGQCCTAVAALPDSPAKWQRLQMIRRAMDQSVLGYKPNLVMPDGGVVHHGGYHVDYAGYSFGAVVATFEMMETCGITSPATAEISRRFLRTGRQWAWIHAGDQIIPNLYLRVRLPAAASPRPAPGSGMINFALAAARFRHAAGGLAEAEDPELAGLCLAVAPAAVPADLRAEWTARQFTARPPRGHLSLPSAGAAIHRRDHWTVVLRGQHKFLRGGEGMPYGAWGQAITYGGRFCRGSMFVIDTGNPPNIADSGYVAEGFDFSRVPGTTGEVGGPEQSVSGYIETKATQGGGCDLQDQGIWAWAENGIHKSAFLVDGRITHLTTGAVAPATAKFMTTVLQAAEPVPAPMMVDGQAMVESGVLRLAGGAAHTLLDGRGRGYFIHPGGDDLEITRGIQSWTYCEIPYFKRDNPDIEILDSVRCHVIDKREVNQPADSKQGQYVSGEISGPAKLRYFTPTSHRFTTAGFVHTPGTPPSRAHAFTLLPATTAAALGEFATGMQSANPPVRILRGAGYHGYVDGATGLRGWCLFAAGALPADGHDGITRAVSRPCTLLEQRIGDKLELAMASTDITIAGAYELELRGRWTMDDPPAGARATITGDATRLVVPFHYMTVESLHLHRAPD